VCGGGSHRFLTAGRLGSKDSIVVCDVDDEVAVSEQHYSHAETMTTDGNDVD
jgi:hypothetical protein